MSSCINTEDPKIDDSYTETDENKTEDKFFPSEDKSKNELVKKINANIPTAKNIKYFINFFEILKINKKNIEPKINAKILKFKKLNDIS